MSRASKRILITAGSTREPIDPVRFIGNRSSGRMGISLFDAARIAGHAVSLITGPMTIPLPRKIFRHEVETAAEMHAAVTQHFPQHDILIMAAAVADFRPLQVSNEKLPRSGQLSIACEPTEDIAAAAATAKRSDQRVIAFSLEHPDGIDRAREKMNRKRVDLMVFNPLRTMNANHVQATLLYPDGHDEPLAEMPKPDFAALLIERAAAL